MMVKRWSNMTMHERSESIHPAKQVAALKAQIDNYELELSKTKGSEMRQPFISHLKVLRKKLNIAEQELNKIKIVDKMVIEK